MHLHKQLASFALAALSSLTDEQWAQVSDPPTVAATRQEEMGIVLAILSLDKWHPSTVVPVYQPVTTN